jgi:hypothetical protein
MANPFRRDADMANLIDGLKAAGLQNRPDVRPISPADKTAPTHHQSNTFKQTNGLWQISYAGASVLLPEVKGFHDLARLMATPGTEVHCTQLMDSPDTMSEDAPVMDARALKSYEAHIRDLREAIGEAKAMNDLVRCEKLNAELDQLTEHISKALGMGRRTRKLNAAAERARSAVTWRIRNAIKKIEAAHPDLALHLTNSIRTGTFCCYEPETDQAWHL